VSIIATAAVHAELQQPCAGGRFAILNPKDENVSGSAESRHAGTTSIVYRTPEPFTLRARELEKSLGETGWALRTAHADSAAKVGI